LEGCFKGIPAKRGSKRECNGGHILRGKRVGGRKKEGMLNAIALIPKSGRLVRPKLGLRHADQQLPARGLAEELDDYKNGQKKSVSE